jgi:glycosyltransferase involved in cell wall biosynthesis
MSGRVRSFRARRATFSIGEPPLRIVMIGPYPGSPDKIDGGAASALTYLSQELASRPGIDLIGVRIADTRTASRSSGKFAWPVVDLPLGRLGLSTLYRRQRRDFAGMLQRYRPDVVHGQGVDLPGFIAVHCGLPSVVTVHGILGEETRYEAGLSARVRSSLTGVLLERPTIRRATDLISISPYVSRHYRNLMRGRVHEIPNPISQRYFDIKRDPERGRLLFAGRIIRRKGVLDLVRAFGDAFEESDCLVLAGAATDRDYDRLVRQEAAHRGIIARVEFRGLVDEAAILEEFSRASALVLPSYQETAPMVIQQAMAAGIPVIATRICGIPDQIEDGATGLLYEAGAVDQLAGLIRRLRMDPLLAARIGEAARMAATGRYRAAPVADATLRAYEAILCESSAQSPAA